MLEDFFTLCKVIARHRTGLFGAYIDEFVAQLDDEGYKRRTVRSAVAAVQRFGRWMDRHGQRARDASEKTIGEFCRMQCAHAGRRAGEAAALRVLLVHLRRLGIASMPVQPEVGILERIAQGFATYLRQERALSEATLKNYVPVARLFMDERCASGSSDLAKLCAVDIHEFVLRRVRSCCPKRMQLILTALRSFLRFLYLRGQLAAPLAEHLPKVAGWRLSEPPKWLASDAIERTLASCDRRSDVGQRDYAILMLLARLGLRAGEIVSMELEDIRWETGEIRVCGKGQQRKCFPLSQEVGKAVAAYLENVRRPCGSRRVFLRIRAPYRGLANSASLGAIVRRALSRAGLDPPSKGAHLFRHSLATHMLQNGATLTEIGQILHHKSPNTTAIYAKADISGLRALARPWPGDRS